MRQMTVHEHRFTTVARSKGRRVRYQCDTCPKIGPWIRLETLAAKQQVRNSLEAHNVTELRVIAKTRGLHNYSHMRRDELIAALTK